MQVVQNFFANKKIWYGQKDMSPMSADKPNTKIVFYPVPEQNEAT